MLNNSKSDVEAQPHRSSLSAPPHRLLLVLQYTKMVGVHFELNMQFDRYASTVDSACNYHLQALRHNRGVLSGETAETIGCSIVQLKLDYRNWLMYDASSAIGSKLQQIQNRMVRTVAWAPIQVSSVSALQSLHWLPVTQRIKRRVALLPFMVRTHTSQPI